MLKLMERSQFEQVFKIMDASFPDDEKRPYKIQKQLLDNKYYKIYVECDEESGDVKGFFALYTIDDCNFLEHFAVDPKYRNGGIGARLINEIVNILHGTIVLEVETPINEMAARRIAFYERNGFVLNKYSYMQPPIYTGRNAMPLYIMSYKQSLTQREFEAVRLSLYKDIYHCKVEDYL